MALLLRRRGITRVRPLLGGFEAWRRHAFPIVTPAGAGIAATLASADPLGDGPAA